MFMYMVFISNSQASSRGLDRAWPGLAGFKVNLSLAPLAPPSSATTVNKALRKVEKAAGCIV
jgi:hypothetical protein